MQFFLSSRDPLSRETTSTAFDCEQTPILLPSISCFQPSTTTTHHSNPNNPSNHNMGTNHHQSTCHTTHPTSNTHCSRPQSRSSAHRNACSTDSTQTRQLSLNELGFTQNNNRIHPSSHHHPMSAATDNKPTMVNIWRQNLNKLDIAQQDLTNSIDPNTYDIITLQEPYIDFLGNTCTNQRWYPLLPTAHCNNPKKTQAVTLINKRLLSSSWQQNMVNMQDIVSVSIVTSAGTIIILNIYNNSAHSSSLQVIQKTLEENALTTRSIDPTKMIWLGNFNQHHPLWDEECNSHLFTTNNLDTAHILLDLLTDYDMIMALPKNTLTLRATCSKNLTCLDNIFCSN